MSPLIKGKGYMYHFQKKAIIIKSSQIRLFLRNVINAFPDDPEIYNTAYLFLEQLTYVLRIEKNRASERELQEKILIFLENISQKNKKSDINKDSLEHKWIRKFYHSSSFKKNMDDLLGFFQTYQEKEYFSEFIFSEKKEKRIKDRIELNLTLSKQTLLDQIENCSISNPFIDIPAVRLKDFLDEYWYSSMKINKNFDLCCSENIFCELKEINHKILEVVERISLEFKRKSATEDLFVSHFSIDLKNNPDGYHIDHLLTFKKIKPMTPFLKKLILEICSIYDKTETKNLEIFIEKKYNISKFNKPYLLKIEEILLAEDCRFQLEKQFEKISEIQKKSKESIEKAEIKLRSYQKNLREYEELKKTIFANDEGIKYIFAVESLKNKLESEKELIIYSENQYVISDDLIFSDSIREKLRGAKNDFFIMKSKIENHNNLVKKIMEMSLDIKALTKYFHNFSEETNPSLKSIFKLESEIKNIDFNRCFENENSHLVDMANKQKEILYDIRKQSLKIISQSLKIFDSNIKAWADEKIVFLKKKQEEIDEIMNKPALHPNLTVQKDLKEVQEKINVFCEDYKKIIEHASSDSEKIREKIIQLNHQNEIIKAFLKEKNTSWNDANYATNLGRKMYESLWGALKFVVLTLLHHYNASEHYPRRVKAQKFLESIQKNPSFFKSCSFESGLSVENRPHLENKLV